MSKKLISQNKNFFLKFFQLKLFVGIKQLFENKYIRKRLIFTVIILFIYRFLANVPPPGVNILNFSKIFEGDPVSNLFTLATGGRLDNPSVVMIGLGAYINASIIIQLLSTVIPKLEELSNQGATGRQILNQYTRFLTIPLSILQAIVVYILLSRTGDVPGQFISQDFNLSVVAFVASIAGGSMILMWLSELINENGIGNGSSLIIAFSIISSLPGLLNIDLQGIIPVFNLFMEKQITLFDMLQTPSFIFLYGLIIGVIVMVLILILMNEAERKVNIQYARRVAGGAQNYLPIRLNQAGVMPIIFASSILTFPSILAQLAMNISQSGFLYNLASQVSGQEKTWLSFLSDYTSYEYNILYFLLIIGFTYFYTFVILKPNETADNLKKNGAFIPGIRPGKTTEKFLTSIMVRLTLVGSLFLAFITIVPTILKLQLDSTTHSIGIISGIGGTSLLIVISVILTVNRQIQSLKVTKSYDKYR